MRANFFFSLVIMVLLLNILTHTLGKKVFGEEHKQL